jgi:hypothetical protein
MTYRDDVNSLDLSRCHTFREDYSELNQVECDGTRQGSTENAFCNSLLSDLTQSYSFQGEQRQRDNDELILMNYLPSMGSWGGEGGDWREKKTKKVAGGRLRRKVQKLGPWRPLSRRKK